MTKILDQAEGFASTALAGFAKVYRRYVHLVRGGVVSRADLQVALSRKMGYPIVDVAAFPVENEAALRLPLAAARRLTALPLMMRAGRLGSGQARAIRTLGPRLLLPFALVFANTVR